MDERFCTVGEVELCYETFGDAADPTVLLVMGLGMQMIAWREPFCRQLAERGFHVVRFDNRDAGRSTHLLGAPTPTRWQLLRRRVPAAYTLADMAADGIGLLDHLGDERAHVVGVSMGGMVAQTMAARHPERVLSLTSIMANTGSRWRGQPQLSTYPVLLSVGPGEHDAYVEHAVAKAGLIASPGFDADPADLRELASLSWRRGLVPGGVARQLAAIIASGDRTAELRSVRAPTVVIHGDRDRLVRPSGGRATARAIPGARLQIIHGMGHDLPRGAWPQIIDAIAGVAGHTDSMSFLFREKSRMVEADRALPGREQAMPVPERHVVLGTPLQPPFPEGTEQVVLGLGCFWGAERLFWQTPGVYTTAVGYAGGFTANPTYEEVCSGSTGHTEVVLVVFDPQRVTLEEILRVFWEGHDPTQGMRQGNDVGTQYRSAIYTSDDAQRTLAEASKQMYERELLAAGHGAITTEIAPAGPFYYAEDYHQQYLAKVPNGYCGLGGTGVSCPIGLAT